MLHTNIIKDDYLIIRMLKNKNKNKIYKDSKYALLTSSKMII